MVFFGPSFLVREPGNPMQRNATTSLNGGRLEMPVLFIGAMYDYTCETISLPRQGTNGSPVQQSYVESD